MQTEMCFLAFTVDLKVHFVPEMYDIWYLNFEQYMPFGFAFSILRKLSGVQINLRIEWEYKLYELDKQILMYQLL